MQFNKPFATVTPTLDGEVLAVLAAHDATFTTGQIHRVLGEFSDEGIRKVLSRLVLQGVVLVDRVGPTLTYKLNTEHLASGPIQALARLGSTFTARLEQYLESWEQPPVYGALFGSAARGLMTVDSDLDLLLVRNRDATEDIWVRQLNKLAETATRWTGNDTRVVDYTVEDLRNAASEPMLQDVLKHGLTVAGSRAWLMRELNAARKESQSR